MALQPPFSVIVDSVDSGAGFGREFSHGNFESTFRVIRSATKTEFDLNSGSPTTGR
jgi:hypothetical protein